MEHLSRFVLVRLRPRVNEAHRRFARRFGVTRSPALLFLDWQGSSTLGWIGDVSEEEVAAKLQDVLERSRGE